MRACVLEGNPIENFKSIHIYRDAKSEFSNVALIRVAALYFHWQLRVANGRDSFLMLVYMNVYSIYMRLI